MSPSQALFGGLIFDEQDQPVEVTYVGEDPCYVINDAGFKRHIPSEEVDRQVFNLIKEQIQGHEELISQQAAKMLGQEDLFTHAIILNQLKQIDQQFDMLSKRGFPEEGRAYLGMMGFRITINLHGEVIKVAQPGTTSPEEE